MSELEQIPHHYIRCYNERRIQLSLKFGLYRLSVSIFKLNYLS
ncbi:hypothetical protein [Caviibacterium pharyngocola]